MKRVFNLVTSLSLLVISLCALSCTEESTDDGTSLSGDLVLVPTATEVPASESSYIEFNAYIGSTDVTLNPTLEIFYVDADYNLTTVNDFRFDITEVGEYKFYATCTVDNKIVQSEIVVVEGVFVNDLTITASTEQIVVGVTENNSVSLSVYLGEEQLEITDENVKLFVVDGGSTTQLTEAEYIIDDERTCSFYATYNMLGTELKSNEVEVSALVTFNIIPSAYSVKLDSAQSTTVSIEAKFGNDVIAISDSNFKLYYVDGETQTALSSLDYTVDQERSYNFYSTYSSGGTQYSAEFSLVGFNWEPIAFNKRIFAQIFTATWCSFCPMVTAGIYHYEHDYSDDKIVVSTAHVSDDMQNNYSYNLAVAYDIAGYPSLYMGSFDSEKALLLGAYSSYSMTLGYIVEAVGLLDELGVATAIAVNTTTSADAIEIDATVAVNRNGQFSVGALIVEDGIVSEQSSNYTNATLGIGDYDLSTHKNVLQAVIATEELGAQQSHVAENAYSYQYSFPISSLESSLSNINNCRLIVYTIDNESGYVDNIIQTSLDSTRAFDTK